MANNQIWHQQTIRQKEEIMLKCFYISPSLLILIPAPENQDFAFQTIIFAFLNRHWPSLKLSFVVFDVAICGFWGAQKPQMKASDATYDNSAT